MTLNRTTVDATDEAIYPVLSAHQFAASISRRSKIGPTNSETVECRVLSLRQYTARRTGLLQLSLGLVDVAEEFRSRRNTTDQQAVAGAGRGDVEQLALRRVDLI